MRWLGSVRAKLTALVGLSLVTMLAVLPVLSWTTHKQLVDEVDDRVEAAERSFGAELRDDLADLALAARLLAMSGETRRAVTTRDAEVARRIGEEFHGVYPDIDILFVDADGAVFASLGCKKPLTRVSDVPELAGLRAGLSFRGMLASGCEGDGHPAFVISAPVRAPGGDGDAGGEGRASVGGVVLCLPIDESYLRNAEAKLGLELAFVHPGREGADMTLATSDGFPRDVRPSQAGAAGSELFEVDGRSWAAARFAPEEFSAGAGKPSYALVAALDVTDIRVIVRKNLYFALGVLLLAGLVSLAWGGRIATVMARALGRMNRALKRLEHREYVHVDRVTTGDEIEDLAHGFNRMVDGLRERDKLRSTFGKYMTESVMDHLLAGRVELGGETLDVTVLFTDIRSFTSISESIDAHAVVAMLNEYFTEMVSIVIGEDGVVDKYIGDAIMAVFGAPVPKPDDPERAVRAAVKMRVALGALNERLAARGSPPIRTGIGIHTGEVVAGNIGSEARMEYTVIGDTVNLASRLEGNTKELGVDILISEATYARVKDIVIVKPVREIVVKGRLRSVMTYEVLGLVDGPSLEKEPAAPVLA